MLLFLALLACTPAPEPVSCVVLFPDGDGDGYGGRALGVRVCDGDAIGQYATNNQDCDDADGAVHPGASGSSCDGVDNDCDGTVDNEDGPSETRWYADQDGDGFGDPYNTLSACEAPAGYTDNNDDCDDRNALINPEGVDTWSDDVDQDCSGDDADGLCRDLVAYPGDVVLSGVGVEAAIGELCWRYNAIGGDLRLSDTDLIDDSALNCFCEIGGNITVSGNALLESVSLSSVDGFVTIEDNPVLTSATTSAPLLGGAIVRHNPALLRAQIHATEESGDITVSDNAVLRELDLVAWERSSSVGDLHITHNPSLDSASWCEAEWGYGPCYSAEIRGSLIVEDNPALESLSFLDGLQNTGLSATVSQNDSLTEAGLPSLESVGGSLTIWGNPALSSIGAIADRVPLVSIGEDLLIGANPELDLLYMLTPDVGGSVFFWDMTDLASANAYSEEPRHISGSLNLRGVGTDLRLFTVVETVGGDVVLEDTDWVELGGLTSIGGDVRVEGAKSDAYLPLLVSVGGEVSVLGSHEQTPFDMPSLQTVGGGLSIEECSALTDLSNIASLQSIGGDLRVVSNASLVSLEDIAGLSVPGYAYFGYNDVLQDVAALEGHTWISGLYISHNEQLASLESLSSLTRVSGQLEITENPQLESFAGLESLEQVGSLQVFSGPSDMTGFSSLESVGYLWVRADWGDERACTLESLEGLTSLEQVWSDLWIDECGSLASLDGLEGLTTISHDLLLTDNPALEDVSAMHGVSGVSGRFYVVGNSALPDASVEALEESMTIYGTVTVRDNGG